MTEFYCPKSDKVKLPSGRIFQLRRGIHHIPDELSNSPQANELGIKPTHEMTDDEWRMLGLQKPPEPEPVVEAKVAPATPLVTKAADVPLVKAPT